MHQRPTRTENQIDCFSSRTTYERSWWHNCIIVLYKGEILGKGRFDELKAKGLLNTTVDPLYKETKESDESFGAPWSLFEIFFKFARLLRRLFLSIVSVTHAVYCRVNVLSSHVMLLTVRDLQLIGSKMNQLSAKFRTHDAILTDPWGVGSLNNHAVLHRSKNRLGIMFMERGSCMRDSLSYLIPSWITANFWSLVQSNS